MKICLVFLFFTPFYPLLLLQKSYTNTPHKRRCQGNKIVRMYTCKLQSGSQIHIQKARKLASNPYFDVHENRILYWPPATTDPCGYSTSYSLNFLPLGKKMSIIYKAQTFMKMKLFCLDNSMTLTGEWTEDLGKEKLAIQ